VIKCLKQLSCQQRMAMNQEVARSFRVDFYKDIMTDKIADGSYMNYVFGLRNIEKMRGKTLQSNTCVDEILEVLEFIGDNVAYLTVQSIKTNSRKKPKM